MPARGACSIRVAAAAQPRARAATTRRRCVRVLRAALEARRAHVRAVGPRPRPSPSPPTVAPHPRPHPPGGWPSYAAARAPSCGLSSGQTHARGCARRRRRQRWRRGASSSARVLRRSAVGPGQGGGARVEVKIRVKIRVKPRPQCAGRAPLSAAPHPNPSSNLRRASTYARCVLLTLRSTRRSTTRAPRASMRCGASSLRTPQRPNTKPHPNANANP